jgi:hypothetical protein
MQTVIPQHIALVDPKDAAELIPAYAGMAYHVSAGHVSDPSAHHARYTDGEAIVAEVEITKATIDYSLGNIGSAKAHIQAVGSGTVTAVNPHGIAPSDIGALAGFDQGGQIPTQTQELLQNLIVQVGLGLLPGPFGAPSENTIDPAQSYRITGGLKTLSTVGVTTIATGLSSITVAFVGNKTATADVTFWVESTSGMLEVAHGSTSGTDEIWWFAVGLVT